MLIECLADQSLYDPLPADMRFARIHCKLMKFIHILTVVAVFMQVAAQARATIHYTYSAANPSVPVRTETPSSCVAGSSEFTTYAGIPERAGIIRVTTDSAGNTFLAGYNQVPGVSGSFTQNPFVAKVDANGCLLFTVTIQTGGYAQALAIAVDGSGRIYAAGSRSGSDFPLKNPLRSEPSTGFIVRLAADGSHLLSSTYIDGTVNGMVLDDDGNAYLTGETYSSTFPDTLRVSRFTPRVGPGAIHAAFFLKLNPTVDRILASGYLAGYSILCIGGSSCDLSTRVASGQAIAVDRDRNILFAGNTNTTNLLTSVDAFRPQGIGAFIAKVSPDGSRLLYSTYIGERQTGFPPFASPATVLSGMTVDGAGDAIMAGRTSDDKFPATAGTVQPAYSGPVDPPANPYINIQSDAFVAKLDITGSHMLWATYFGTNARNENFESISTGSAGNLLLAGTTAAVSPSGFDSTLLVTMDPNGTKVSYSGIFGPGWGSVAQIDRSGLIHASGSSGIVSVFRPAGPLSPRIFGLTSGAGGQITGEIAPGEIVSIYGTGIGPAQATNFMLDGNGRVPTSLSGVQVFFGDLPAPLLYVSANQINAIVPNAVPAGTSVTVRVTGDAQPFTAQVYLSSAKIFAGVRNADGSPNNSSNPAQAGSVVTAWLTGVGADSRPDGSIATGVHDTGCCQARVNGRPLEVLYAGDAPGFVTALTQVNIRVPSPNDVSPEIDVITAGGKSVSVRVFVSR